MTVADPIEPKQGFNLPTWAMALIVIVALVGAGWLVWWYVFGGAGPKEHAIVIENAGNVRLDGAPRQRGGGTGTRSGVQTTRDGSWSVRSGEYAMIVRKLKPDTYHFVFFNPGYSIIPTDQRVLLRIRRDLTNNLIPKDVKVTPEQVAALKKVQQLGALTVSDADKQAMKQLWDSYLAAKDAAAKSDIDKKIVTEVADIGKRSIEPTKAVAADRAKQIASILTPDQIEKLKARVGP